MTNNEIIYSESIAAGIYTQDQADAILSSGHALPIHTFPEWKRMGYSVKKGEKAAIKTRLWKYTTQPTKAAREAAELAGKEPDADPHYYLAPAYLFTAGHLDGPHRTKRPDPSPHGPNTNENGLIWRLST